MSRVCLTNEIAFFIFIEGFAFLLSLESICNEHRNILMLSDFGALCRVVWIFGNIRRFNPHAGVVLREYDDD